MSKWTKVIFNKEVEAYQVILAPEFADLSKTQFPNGLRLLGRNYITEDEAVADDTYLRKVFAEMEEGYAEEKKEEGFDTYEEYYRKTYYREPDMNSYGIFASNYTDFENSKPYEYPKFLPHFVDLEGVGFSHGISIGEKRFFGENSRKEVINFISQIDDFFFFILGEYEQKEFNKNV